MQLSFSIDSIPVAKPLEVFRQTFARPLFFKTREPFVAPPPPPPAPLPKPVAPAPVFSAPGLAVGGIIVSRGLRKAYLFTTANPRGTWVSEGDDFAGWKVQSITAGGTTPRQADHTIDLQLYVKR